jgi:hypothetical protein
MRLRYRGERSLGTRDHLVGWRGVDVQSGTANAEVARQLAPAFDLFTGEFVALSPA